MKTHVFVLLMVTNLVPDDQVMSRSDIHSGYQVTLAIPAGYTGGFLGRAFIMEAQQSVPRFRAAVSVEAVDGKYACSLDVLLGDVRVWTSGHSSRFFTEERCVLELSETGDLTLKDHKGGIGWRSGTSGQGVERLELQKTGNLELLDALNLIRWQSFNFPTDTMLWGQRLSSQTRLISFPANSTMYYSMEIQDNNIGLYLNLGSWKYSYWEYQPPGSGNITFMEVNTHGLEIFNGKRKFDQIRSTGMEAVRFLALDNATGNLRMYRYSEEHGKFEASYWALNFSCDLPLACNAYNICTLSGSCSCIGKGGVGEVCGKDKVEMVEVGGVVSILKSGENEGNVSKEGCAKLCLDENWCVAAQHDEVSMGCYVYNVVRGVKEVGRGQGGGVTYMVKVGRGSNHGRGGKRWVMVVVGVVDGFIILVVVGGVVYYVVRKRRRNLGGDRGHGS